MGSAAAAPSPAPERRPTPERKPEVKRSVFISHSTEDKPFVRQLVADLEADRAPVDLWLDEQRIGLGDSIVGGVSEAIEKTDYLLLIHSKNSAGSPWVKREVEAATNIQIKGGGIVVVAAVLDVACRSSYSSRAGRTDRLRGFFRFG